jgi:hypothetical protein
MMKRRPTKELRVAEKMGEMVNDLTLDLDQVGVYIASDNSITYRRLMEVAEAAKFEKEERELNDYDY